MSQKFIFVYFALMMCLGVNTSQAQTIIEETFSANELAELNQSIEFNTNPSNFSSDLKFFQDLNTRSKLGLKILLGPLFSYNHQVSFEENPSEIQSHRVDSSGQISPRMQTNAVNLGLHFWLLKIYRNFKKVALNILDNEIEISNPSQGIVYLAESFFDEDRDSHLLSMITRARILSHESKHSQCHTLQSCGFAHTLCGRESPFPGRKVCDENESGAIGSDVEFLRTVLQSKKNDLNEYEKQKIILDMSFSLSLIGSGK
jgi:hypothetical protein